MTPTIISESSTPMTLAAIGDIGTIATLVADMEPVEADGEGDGVRVPKSSVEGGPATTLTAPGAQENVVGTLPIRLKERAAKFIINEDSGDDAAIIPPATEHPCAVAMLDEREAPTNVELLEKNDASAVTFEKAALMTIDEPLVSDSPPADVAVACNARARARIRIIREKPPTFAGSLSEKYTAFCVVEERHSADVIVTAAKGELAMAARPRRKSVAMVETVV